MSDSALDILVEVSPGETRAALVDSAGDLCRLRLARLSRTSLVGGIYLGRVVKIEKGMGAAFIDIGLPAPAFLGRFRSLQEGEKLVVQVVRDAWSTKAASVIATPMVAGRYLAVGFKRNKDTNITCERSIGSRSIRERLQATAREIAEAGEEIRVKASAGSVQSDVLAAEAVRLRRRWQTVEDAAANSEPPRLLEAPAGLMTRLLREIAPIRQIFIDNLPVHGETARLVAAEMPDLEAQIIHHGGDQSLFAERGVDEQIDEALDRCVSLPSGVNLTIDPTEALTAIDVNLGGATTGGNQEEVCTRANLEAIPLVARQIILRNLAGLVVIDFISMRNKSNRRRIIEALRKALRARDDGAVDVLGMTAAGLAEVTRQRSGPALADYFTSRQAPAPDPEALACAALRDALRMRGPGRPVLLAAPDVIAALDGSLSTALVETSRQLGQPLALRPDNRQSGFEVVLE